MRVRPKVVIPCGGRGTRLAPLTDEVPEALAVLPEIWRLAADNRKARDLLGRSPSTDFEAGIGLTIDWFRGFLERDRDAWSRLGRENSAW